MLRALLLIVLILPSFTYLTAQQPFNPKGVEYLWPTNADIYLSASFGETRFSHFHAGIDVKTWGKEGYEIYATRDGLLHRLGVSPYGYGNVIYLKHEDGSYSVYAHLRNFIPELEVLADSLRLDGFRYRVNENVEAENIRFKKGDLIGYSGSSGSGPAHIHFELRTPTESPFNPLLTNIGIRDTKAPRFSAMSVEPLSYKTKINNAKKRRIKRPVIRKGIYFFGTVDVEGPFGLAADISDGADDVLNIYAAYKIQLFEGDQLLFEARADSFSYSQTRMVKIDRVYELLNQTRKGYQKLYRSDGNSLPFYTAGQALKHLDPKPGMHEYQIVAWDFNGNKSEARIKINYTKKPNDKKPNELRIYKQDKIALQQDWGIEMFRKWFWSKEVVRAELQSNEYLGMKGYFGGKQIMIAGLKSGDHIDYTEYDSLQIIGPNSKKITLYRLTPDHDEDFILHSGFGNFKLKIPTGAVLDTMPMLLVDSIDGKDVHLFPDTYPLIQNFKLTTTTKLRKQIQSNSVFVQPYIGRETFAGGAFNKEDSSLSISTYIPASFSLGEDTTAPGASGLGWYRRKRDRLRLIGIQPSDNFSGIDLVKSRVFLNDIEGIPEYNPDRGVLMFYHPKHKAQRGDSFRIILADQAGNKQEFSFRVP